MAWTRWNKRKPTREMEALRDSIGSIPLQTADSIHTAPGWCLLGDDFYTMIEPSDGPKVDPVVLRLIHSFDPGLIPFWRKQRWLLPNKTGQAVVSHICIGRFVRNPHRHLQIFRMETPVGFKGVVPNEFEFILENARGTGAYDDGGPGSPTPFSMGLYHMLRESYNEMLPGDKYFERVNKRKMEKLEKARAASLDQSRYRGRHLQAFIDKQLEKASSTEFKEYIARMRAKQPYGGKNRVSLSMGIMRSR